MVYGYIVKKEGLWYSGRDDGWAKSSKEAEIFDRKSVSVFVDELVYNNLYDDEECDDESGIDTLRLALLIPQIEIIAVELVENHRQDLMIKLKRNAKEEYSVSLVMAHSPFGKGIDHNDALLGQDKEKP